MFSIERTSVPEDALLKTFRGGAHPERWGRYGDCFAVLIDHPVGLSEFVAAFYTSPVFRIERWLLSCMVGTASTDNDARGVAEGSRSNFAIWRVGDRTPTQLLMCDRYERTRSWFRVVPANDDCTSLQFGSAISDTGNARARSNTLGTTFNLLLGVHIVYSQVLLHAAKLRLMRRG